MRCQSFIKTKQRFYNNAKIAAERSMKEERVETKQEENERKFHMLNDWENSVAQI